MSIQMCKFLVGKHEMMVILDSRNLEIIKERNPDCKFIEVVHEKPTIKELNPIIVEYVNSAATPEAPEAQYVVMSNDKKGKLIYDYRWG